MNALPFSSIKRADRSCYSVSFKDANGKCLRPVSTGKKTEKEALEIAFKWLRDGVDRKTFFVSFKSTRSVSSGDACSKFQTLFLSVMLFYYLNISRVLTKKRISRTIFPAAVNIGPIVLKELILIPTIPSNNCTAIIIPANVIKYGSEIKIIKPIVAKNNDKLLTIAYLALVNVASFCDFDFM